MSNMTNPLEGLLELQAGIESGLQMIECPGDSGLSVVFDQPEGVIRMTYAMIEDGVVSGYTVFVKDQPIGGVDVFDIGYAIREEYRGKGLATRIVTSSIELLTDTMRFGGHFDSYYIEAIVGVGNLPSNKLARKIISDSPKQIVDEHSGEDAYQYLRLVRL